MNFEQYKTKEASWCKLCAKRKTCPYKESVAIEEMLTKRSPSKFLKVTVDCAGFVKDIKLPADSDGLLKSIFIK